MGNKLMPTHRLHFSIFDGAATMPVFDRTHPASVASVQSANQSLSKIDRHNRTPFGLQSHPLANERFPYEPLPPAPLDLPVAAHSPHGPAGRIGQLGQSPGIFSPTDPIPAPGRLLSQRLVRTFLVVAPQPHRDPMLLALPGPRHGAQRFPFEHPMKLFVRAVVLGMSGPGELHRDPQPPPPHAQTRKSRRPGRGKGSAIVHADDLRQPALPKQPRKHGARTRPPLIGQQPRRQAISAAQVPHRQRLAALTIARAKPALEIHRPHLVGSLSQRQRRMQPHSAFAGSSPGLARQLEPTEPAAHRPQRRHTPALTPKPDLNFLWSPVGMLFARPSDARDRHRLQPARHLVRSPLSVAQSAAATLGETRPPFVGRLAAHAKKTTPLTDRLFVPEQCLDQAPPLPNNRMLFPRHDRSKSSLRFEKCYPCLGLQLLPMCWPHAEREVVKLIALCPSQLAAIRKATASARGRNAAGCSSSPAGR